MELMDPIERAADVKEMAEYMGIDVEKEMHLVWVAKLAVIESLPEVRRVHVDPSVDPRELERRLGFKHLKHVIIKLVSNVALCNSTLRRYTESVHDRSVGGVFAGGRDTSMCPHIYPIHIPHIFMHLRLDSIHRRAPSISHHHR